MNPHPRPTLARRLRASFTEHLPLKLTAVFFALVLWLVVSAEEPTEEVMAVRFEPALDSGVVVVGTMPNVRALVLGSGREILKLYNAAPVIHRRVRSGVRDSIRVELGPADVDLPAGVTADVRDVRPRVVTLHLRRVTPLLASDTATDIDSTPLPRAGAASGDTATRDSLADSTAGGDVRRIDSPLLPSHGGRKPTTHATIRGDTGRQARP